LIPFFARLKEHEGIHFVNPIAALASFTLDGETLLKIAVFILVTLPLAITQWWNVADRWKARQAKKNAAR
jgi:hypothetical protein